MLLTKCWASLFDLSSARTRGAMVAMMMKRGMARVRLHRKKNRARILSNRLVLPSGMSDEEWRECELLVHGDSCRLTETYLVMWFHSNHQKGDMWEMLMILQESFAVLRLSCAV